MKTCEKCKYFEKTNDMNFGECRINSIIYTDRGSKFPNTRKEYWCGQWKELEELKPVDTEYEKDKNIEKEKDRDIAKELEELQQAIAYVARELIDKDNFGKKRYTLVPDFVIHQFAVDPIRTLWRTIEEYKKRSEEEFFDQVGKTYNQKDDKK